jgi:ABC-2 type transport system permease protein
VGANLRVTEALAGTLNVVPVALLCIGAAQLAVGWMPRAVLPVGATPAAGGFLLTVLTQTFGWPDWLAQLSPFAHLGSVPATSPDWAGAAGMMGVAALLINCDCHGSKYSITDGSVVNPPAPKPLAPKTIKVSGDTLTVT